MRGLFCLPLLPTNTGADVQRRRGWVGGGKEGQVSHLSKKNCPRVQKARKTLFEDLRLLQSGRETELNSKYNRDKWGFLTNGRVRNWMENY